MDNIHNLPTTSLALPKLPKFSPSPKKRPRPPLPFDDEDEDDVPREQNNINTPQPQPHPSIPKSQFTNSQINHLQRTRLRRLMARRAAPPKRKRSPIPLEPVSSSTSRAPVDPAKFVHKFRPDQQQRGTNGRILPPPSSRSSSPQTLWHRLASAQANLAAKPRPDPRFVSGRRPLDCLPSLRASIAVTLFADGYARHDFTANASDNSDANPRPTPNGDLASVPQENAVVTKPGASPPGKLSNSNSSAKTTNVSMLPRYPYDRASRDFLQSLDLGLIPPTHDLPEPTRCHYYDGCLIAEVTDLRDVPSGAIISPRPDTCRRVLLRPCMSSVYSDVTSFTRHVDSNVAMLVEQKIIAAIAGPVDCDPRPKLSCSLQSGNVHSNITAINIARRPKRRRVNRPLGAQLLPKLSTPALLLIGAAEKHQALLRNALLGISGASETSSMQPGGATIGTTATSSTNATGRNTTEGSASNEGRNAAARAGTVTAPTTSQNSKLGVRRPPKSILQLHADKNATALAALRQAQAPQLARQERLRFVRLIMPDQNGKIAYQRVLAAEAAMAGENAERIQQRKEQALAAMTKSAAPVFELQLVKSIHRGFEILIARFTCGEKSKDVFRVQVGSEEEGHGFLKQFQTLACKEGFVVRHDVKWSQALMQQQHHQQQQGRAALQRHNSANSAAQIGMTQSQPNAQNQAGQAKMAPARAMSQSHLPASAQQLYQLQKQKQLQMQRQQQLQRQRQQAQAQSNNPSQQHLNHLHQTAHHQAVQHSPQLTIPQAGQPQLSQTQHRPHLTLQQQQQLLQHHQIQMQHHQNVQRARGMQQQMPGLDKNNVNMPQSPAMLGANGRGGQIASKGSGTVPGNMTVPRGTGPVSSIANMGSAGLMGHNQVFPPSHMQQFQQIRTQQLRTEHQRMAAVGAGDGATGFARNPAIGGNPVMAQQLQTQALAGLIGSAAMASGGTRHGAVPTLTGADALTHQRLQQHLKQQRENVEAQARTGKR